MQSASEQVIPEGMVAYGPDHPNYPNAPKDWERHRPVKFRLGTYTSEDGTWTWRHGHYPEDIVAYTPSPAPMVEQAGEVIQADIDLAEEVVNAANIVSHDGYYEVDTEAVAKVIARHRLNTRPAPADAGMRFKATAGLRRQVREIGSVDELLRLINGGAVFGHIEVAALQTNELAALNSQAHQIREGDHG